ncbi:hypothetical protein [Nocardioides zeicaulis]|uniref:Uncharacterized protein n=1 Tax=Nocardioides zeicaulis TaxID=1776857 RepID=A0ABV6DX73_9ACTN
MSEPGDRHEVGSLGEEAAKLFGALSGWAREQADEAEDGLSAMAARAAATARDLDEHLATGSAECTVCPICRVVHAVRQVSPDVTTHLAAAASSLVSAASALLATDPGPRGARPSGGVGVDGDDPDQDDDVTGRAADA